MLKFLKSFLSTINVLTFSDVKSMNIQENKLKDNKNQNCELLAGIYVFVNLSIKLHIVVITDEIINKISRFKLSFPASFLLSKVIITEHKIIIKQPRYWIKVARSLKIKTLPKKVKMVEITTVNTSPEIFMLFKSLITKKIFIAQIKPLKNSVKINIGVKTVK